MSYRNEGWWDIVEEVGWALRAVAARTGDGGTVVAVDWELMNSSEYYRNWIGGYGVHHSDRAQLSRLIQAGGMISCMLLTAWRP